MTPDAPNNPQEAPKPRRPLGLRGLNTAAGVAAGVIAWTASSGGPAWVSLGTLAFLGAVLMLWVVLPIGWLILAAVRLRSRLRTRGRGWPTLGWVVLPVLLLAHAAGPLVDWPLAARVHLHAAELDAVAAELEAAPPDADGRARLMVRRRVGPFSVIHAWRTADGVFLGLTRSPDGEAGLWRPAGRPRADGRGFRSRPASHGWRWYLWDWDDPAAGG